MGGITAYNYRGKIQNCYNIGKIIGSGAETIIGGIVGSTSGKGTLEEQIAKVNLCYNIGDIEKGGAIAGTNGENDSLGFRGNGTIVDCYYLTGSASKGVVYTNSRGTSTTYAVSQSEMPTVLSVINEDNVFVEDTENINNGYPLLAWQVETNG